MKRWVQVLAVFMLSLLLLGTIACSKNEDATENSAWCYAFKHQGALSDQGYYYGANASVLHFADIDTGVSTVLCSTVGCTHTKSDVCGAIIPGLSSPQFSVFFWDNHLYYIDSDGYGTYLYRRDATGNAQMRIGSLLTGYTEKQKTILITSYAVTEGFLYYAAQIRGLLENDLGSAQVQREKECIGRMNLKTGEEEILIEEHIDNNLEYITLCAVRNGEVLFTHNIGAAIGKENPNYQQIWGESPVLLKCWNQKGDIAIKFRKTYQECTKVGMVYGSNIYYTAYQLSGDGNRSYETHTYNLATGKDSFVAKGNMNHLGGGYALSYEDEKGWDIFDLQNNTALPNELSEATIIVRSFSEKGVVFSWLTTNEDDPSGRKESRYYYVRYEALADGLQKTDLVHLYTVQNSV